MKKLWVVLFSAGVLLSPAVRGAELGDPAPALQIAQWVKGGPVDLAEGRGKQVFVVEFWATWCPPCRTSIPHLTDLQKKFKDKGVVFLGVSDEKPDKVQPFVEKMGDKMDYVVALDQDRKTSKAYMGAFGVNGIPHAFVVDQQGRIVWNGHPMAELEKVVEQVLAGKYDLAAAKKREVVQRKLDDYMERARSGKNDEATEQLGKELQALDKEMGGIMPGGEAFDPVAIREDQQLQSLFMQYYRAVTGAGDRSKADQLAGELKATKAKNAHLLNEFAWALLTDKRIKERDLGLAMKLAKAAYQASEGKQAHIVDTYARALFDSGDIQEAIRCQEKAVALAKEPDLRKQLEEVLQQYRQKAKDQ
jgi:peroxiredoxin